MLNGIAVVWVVVVEQPHLHSWREGGEAMWLRKTVFPGSQRERSAPPELSKSDFVETDEAFGKVLMCAVPESKK